MIFRGSKDYPALLVRGSSYGYDLNDVCDDR
jgi:hypothetical protein